MFSELNSPNRAVTRYSDGIFSVSPPHPLLAASIYNANGWELISAKDQRTSSL
ncbi:hypothetical protein M2310_005166 [Rhizobium leguminosarum]|uniref:Uncharacterized protein n=1 Tax=Rhizobium esperanzae TaxID=1967781 RepID=A0A7W6UPF6_9HYPH|nr:hypothetical protein [Rhizobium esperanzae]MDH6204479.1 hypothetical protein [Rhizobium leguminosarum]